VLDPLQGDKLFAMLQRAYPAAPPRVFAAYRGLTYVTGPGAASLPATFADIEEHTARYAAGAATAQVATDDWPYFYMQKRTYPVTYAVMIVILLVLSGLLMRKKLDAPRVTNARGGVFFFLGAGFMLIETKVITELGLVFGNTWSVVAVAITGILLMGYLANHWIARRGPVAHTVSFPLLGVALAAGLGLALSGVVLPWPKVTMPLVLTLPLFFAGLIFSSELARGGAIGDALAANLFGAMLGGFLEYNSMYWGLSSLYPLGMGLYALAFVFALYHQRQAKRATAETDVLRAPAADAPETATLPPAEAA
jgi:hypothetical protein